MKREEGEDKCLIKVLKVEVLVAAGQALVKTLPHSAALEMNSAYL